MGGNVSDTVEVCKICLPSIYCVHVPQECFYNVRIQQYLYQAYIQMLLCDDAFQVFRQHHRHFV